MIKAYFFDWMGTLGNANGDIKDIVTKKESHTLLTNKFEKADISESYKERVYSKLSNVNLNLYHDSERIIKKLNNSNYRLAIISNIYDITSQRIEESFPEFLKQFDVITWSCECGLVKPDKEIFMHTLDKLNREYNLNIAFGEVIMIGDKYEKDILPAERLGMQARLIDRNKQSLEDVI